MGKENDAQEIAPTEQKRDGRGIPIPKVHHCVRKGAVWLLFVFLWFNMILQCRFNENNIGISNIKYRKTGHDNMHSLWTSSLLYNILCLFWTEESLTYGVKTHVIKL